MAIEITTAEETTKEGIRESLGIGEYINAKDYGAVGDAREIQGCSNVGLTITGPAGSFSADDVGKTVFGKLYAGSTVLTVGTVATFTSDTSIVVSGSTTPGGNVGGIYLFIGTNDTTSLQDAWSAASSQGKTLYFPAGRYFFNRQIIGKYNVDTFTPSVMGDGSKNTEFIMMPDYSTSGSVLVSQGYFLLLFSVGPIEIRGFKVNCAYHIVSGVDSLSGAIAVTGTSREDGNSIMSDIVVAHCPGNFSFSVRQSHNLTIDSCTSYHAKAFYIDSSHVNVLNTFCSNGERGFWIASNSVVHIQSGLMDENVYDTYRVDTSTVTIHQGLHYCGGIGPVVNCLNGSTVHLINCELIPYSAAYNTGPIVVAGTGKVTATSCKISKRGTGKAVTGTGTFVDCGGNTITGTVDATTVQGQSFAYPPTIPTATVATLPAATAARICYVSDESGGAVLAFSDGTNWRRSTDRAIVS